MSEPRPYDTPYRSQVVRITDLAVTADLVEGVKFENCQIVGPAVLALLDGVVVQGCSFDGTLDGILWEVAPETLVHGAIGLKNVEFYGCSFSRIGFAVLPELAEQFRSDLGRDSDPGPHSANS